MKISIEAGYPATDGSMPESVRVEIEEDGERPWTTDAVIDVAGAVVDRLNALPAQRYAARFAHQDNRLASTIKQVAPLFAGAPASPSPVCRRTLCGHPKGVHRALDDRGADLGDGNGMCTQCGELDRCRSFVGATEGVPS